MNGILPCMCSSTCQANSTCARLPCFQVRLGAASESPQSPVNRHTDACANHLGAMVISMASWARGQALSNVDLTILAIEPPSSEGYLRRESSECAPTSGLVFSIIHLAELEVAVTDIGPFTPAAWAPNDLGAEVPSTHSLSCWAPTSGARE